MAGPVATLDNVDYRTPDGRELFAALTLSFGRERTGIVGRNGAGKTTLIRLLTGELAPYSGSVTVRGRLATLHQTLQPPPGATLGDVLGVADAVARLDRIEAGAPRDGDLEHADWSLRSRTETALHDVGLADISLDRPASQMSGGELTRARLAAAIVAVPDLLILDEPTNNLDHHARQDVYGLLGRWTGGALVVSHDREVLRRMDRIVEISELGARIYGGGYDLYRLRKEAEAAAAERQFDDAERAVARIARDVQVQRERKQRRDSKGRKEAEKGGAPKLLIGANKRRAEQTTGRQNLLGDRLKSAAAADLDAAAARVERFRALAFDLPRSGLAGGKLVFAMDKVGFEWRNGPRIFSELSLTVTGPERVALTGANGSGKSTFVSLLLGDIAPTSGRVTCGVRAVCLDQRVTMLRDEETLLAAFQRLNPGRNDNAAHAALARFLFRNDAGQRQVGDLSGGERLRAGLACVLMSAHPPQLIVLDEPTNHLDLDSVRAVEAAMRGFDGAILVVSHDKDFLDGIGVTRTLTLDRRGPIQGD